MQQAILRAYFDEVGATKGYGDQSIVAASQDYYCHNQQQNPHTPNVMKSLGLNEQDVDKFCTDMLFPKLKINTSVGVLNAFLVN